MKEELDTIEEKDDEFTNRVNTENNGNFEQNEIIEKLNFQLDLANRKIKNNERTIEQLTSLQSDYEKKFTSITKEFRNLEQSLREKYIEKEKNLEKEFKNNEEVYEKKISNLKEENIKLKNK